MRHGYEEAWWGVLFATFIIGLLLGTLLVIDGARESLLVPAPALPKERQGDTKSR